MNKMYEYLKSHAYISYNKKSTYEFELSEERAECIANKYDSLTEELQQENKILRDNAEHNEKVVDKVNWEKQLLKKKNKQLKIQISAREEEYRELEGKYKELDKMYELYSKSLYNAELSQYKDNWNKLKEWASNFYNSEEVGWAGCGMRYTLEKILELEQGSDSNEL